MTNRRAEGVRVPPPRDSRPHPRPVPPTRASCGCVSRPRFPGGRWLRSPSSPLGGVPALPPRRAGGAGVSLRLWLRLLFRLGERRRRKYLHGQRESRGEMKYGLLEECGWSIRCKWTGRLQLRNMWWKEFRCTSAVPCKGNYQLQIQDRKECVRKYLLWRGVLRIWG